MSGVRRCKEFLHNLSEEERKKIRVKIKRKGIPEPDIPLPFYRGLDDPKSLVIHFKKEASRGIFDREDIVLNQEFPEETSKKDSRDCRRRSSSVEDTFCRREEKPRVVSYCPETSSRNREDRGRSFRSRSRSSGGYRRNRSRSGSAKRRSRSPFSNDKYSRGPHSVDRRSRSFSPPLLPKKKPGLFIPTENDYLRYKKRKADRSRSPLAAYSSTKGGEHSSRLDVDKLRSPRKRSRSPQRRKSSRSPPRHRRSRSLSRERWSRTRSPTTHRRSRRSRSRSRHREREVEEIPHYGNPYIFQDGKFWIPVGPSFLPRGFIPPPQLLYRPFPPPMMMRPNMMQPFRPKIYRPRQQNSVSDTATPSTSKVVQITEVVENDESKPQDSSEIQ